VQPENTAQPVYSLPAMERYNAIPPPVISAQPQNQTANFGQTATFTVQTTFSLPLYYQWRTNGADIGGANSASYTTPATTTDDNRERFNVVISNDHGSVTSSIATLTIVAPYPSWQLQYFGCTNCSQAASNADPAGTGQNNWFKYIAGLDPTNPASRFVVNAAATTNPTSGFKLTYGPLAAGRTYQPWFCTNLAGAHWMAVTGWLGPVINAGSATLTDTNPPLGSRYYRLSISYP